MCVCSSCAKTQIIDYILRHYDIILFIFKITCSTCVIQEDLNSMLMLRMVEILFGDELQAFSNTPVANVSTTDRQVDTFKWYWYDRKNFYHYECVQQKVSASAD